uniref:Uncharacterized protein n=1 Tax=Haemonchus contortus TaxID=6289 RepID=A0A7I4YDI3_HAECO
MVSSAIIVCVVLCGKKSPPKKQMKFAASAGTKPLSRSRSSASIGETPNQLTPTTKTDTIKVAPKQILQMMEAEKMAKASKGYDNVEIDMDDDILDDKPNKPSP